MTVWVPQGWVQSLNPKELAFWQRPLDPIYYFPQARLTVPILNPGVVQRA